MLTQQKVTRSRWSLPWLAVLLIAPWAHAHGASTHTIRDDRSTNTKHGLYEIQQTAATFIQRHNERHGTHWRVGEPDLRLLVRRCVVPLTTAWGAPPSPKRNMTVIVRCSRTVPSSKPWAVDVTVFEETAAASAPR